jgi:hypothetical protein
MSEWISGSLYAQLLQPTVNTAVVSCKLKQDGWLSYTSPFVLKILSTYSQVVRGSGSPMYWVWVTRSIRLLTLWLKKCPVFAVLSMTLCFTQTCCGILDNFSVECWECFNIGRQEKYMCSQLWIFTGCRSSSVASSTF